MTVSGFSHFNLRADRSMLEALRTFYCEVVGLTQGPRPPFRSFGFRLYAGEQDILHLTESRLGEIRHTHTQTTFDHVAFTCSGRAEIEARLRFRGVNFSIDHVPSTAQVQLFFQDPAGNGVELNFAESDA